MFSAKDAPEGKQAALSVSAGSRGEVIRNSLTPRLKVVSLNEEHYDRKELIVPVNDAEKVAGIALREDLPDRES